MVSSDQQAELGDLRDEMLSTSLILRMRWSKRYRDSLYFSFVPYNPEQDAPAKLPSEPCVREVGKTWVSLTWSRPEQEGAPPVTAYKVEAKPMGEENWKEVGLAANSQYDAFNLSPDKEYMFRVTPRNKYGWGEPVATSTPIQLLGPSRPRLPEFQRILPGHFRVLKGYDMKLKCQVKGTADVSWYHENARIEPDVEKGRIRTEVNVDNVHTLLISNVSRSDRGNYVCAAENAAGRVTTHCIVTVVNDPSEVDIDPWMDAGYPRILRTVDEKLRTPEFTMRLRTRRIEVSYPVRMTCHVDGNPQPTINWFKDGELIEPDGRYILMQEGGFHTLEVTSARYEDAALYSVRATNSHGSTTCHASLIVDDGLHAYVSPKFLVDLEDVSVPEGSNLVVEGAIEAYPAAGVICLRDGQRLRLSRRHCLTLDRSGHLSFSLRDIRPTDEGKYSFIVSNLMGKTLRGLRVFVTPPLPAEKAADIDGIPTAPHFIKKPVCAEALEGDSVVLVCEVEGNPPPAVIWAKDFLNPDYYLNGSHFVRVGGPESREYSLTIPRVTLDDTGVYSVTARNVVGEAKSILSLQIFARGQGADGQMEELCTRFGPVDRTPEVIEGLKDIRCCDGDSVTFECRVRGKPIPRITWTKDGMVLLDDKDFRYETDGQCVRLHLNRVYAEDEGLYACIAANEIGKAITRANLYVSRVPEEKENDVTTKVERTKPASHFSSMSEKQGSSMRSRTEDRFGASGIDSGRMNGNTDSGSRMAALSKDKKIVPPKFYAVPHNKIVEEGDTATFYCTVAGEPFPKITWDKDNVKIKLPDVDDEEDKSRDPDKKYRLVVRKDLRILEVFDVSQDDAGLYRVTIENNFGRTQASARLDVLNRTAGPRITHRLRNFAGSRYSVPPQFSRRPSSSSTWERSRGSLSCDIVRGSSVPRCQWYRNGLPVEDDGNVRSSFDGERCTLEFEETLVEHAGEYACKVFSADGENSCSAVLAVTPTGGEKPGGNPFLGSGPEFLATSQIREIAVKPGRPVLLNAKVKGTPPLAVVWVKNDTEMDPSSPSTSSSSEFHSFSDGLTDHWLYFPSIAEEDSGIYFCEAYNALGHTDAFVSRLTVSESVEKEVFDTHLEVCTATSPTARKVRLTDIKSIHVSEGAIVKFRTVASGDPKVSVAWSVNGSPIVPSERFKVIEEPNGTCCLEIDDVVPSDTGTISCRAWNSASEASISADLWVLPDVPDMSGPRQTTPRGSLVPPSALSQISVEEPLVSEESLVPLPEADVVLESPDENDDDDDDQQHFAAVEEKVTPPLIVSGPRSVTVMRGENTLLRANFIGSPPPIIKWYRGGKEVLTDGSRIFVDTFNGVSTLSIESVTSDDSGKYLITVENCVGGHSAFASLAVEGIPDPPAGQPSLAHIAQEKSAAGEDLDTYCATISWYGPAFDGGSVVTGYTLEMKRSGQDWVPIEKNYRHTSSTISGLSPGTNFVVRVRAENVHGCSEPGRESAIVSIPSKSEVAMKPDVVEEKPAEQDEVDSSPSKPCVDVSPGEDFSRNYEVLDELGRGRFGTVYKVVLKTKKTSYAAKFVKCLKMKDKEKVREEIHIMNSLKSHPRLLALNAAFERQRDFIMVTEYVRGGELFERVVADDFTLTERDCILFTRQICDGVAYMHKSHVVHLDLKPENILCVSPHSHDIKIIDFGLARELDPSGEPVRVMFGTPEFIAPEVIAYDPISFASDMWSVGVVTYVLLSGLSPFMGETDAETYANITRAEFDFDDEAFSSISEDAKDFISSLLVKKPTKRLSAENCLSHSWLSQTEKTMNSFKLPTDKLKKFIIRRKWQKTGKAILALGRMAHLRRASESRRGSHELSSVSEENLTTLKWRPATSTPSPVGGSLPGSPSASDRRKSYYLQRSQGICPSSSIDSIRSSSPVPDAKEKRWHWRKGHLQGGAVEDQAKCNASVRTFSGISLPDRMPDSFVATFTRHGAPNRGGSGGSNPLKPHVARESFTPDPTEKASIFPNVTSLSSHAYSKKNQSVVSDRSDSGISDCSSAMSLPGRHVRRETSILETDEEEEWDSRPLRSGLKWPVKAGRMSDVDDGIGTPGISDDFPEGRRDSAETDAFSRIASPSAGINTLGSKPGAASTFSRLMMTSPSPKRITSSGHVISDHCDIPPDVYSPLPADTKHTAAELQARKIGKGALDSVHSMGLHLGLNEPHPR